MVQPYQLNIPNPGEELLAGVRAGQEFMIQHKAQQRQAQMQEALANLSQKENKTTEDYQQVMDQYPELSKQIDQSLSQFTEQQREQKINQLMPIHMALSSGNVDVAKTKVDELITAYRNSNNEMEAKSLETLKSNIELDPKGAETSSELLLMKALGPDAFQRYLQKSIDTKTARRAGAGAAKTVKSEILPNGSVIQVTSDQNIIVKDASGTILSGKSAADEIVKGREYGIDLAKRINFNRQTGTLEAQKELKSEVAGEVRQAEEAVKKSSQFFDRYEKIQENIRTLDEGINIIEKGLAEGKDLGTGPIRRYFPKWGATANNLKNVANRLGLNVVSSVTFGALSEKELEMATQTGMPTNLKGRDLLDWLNRRKKAQQKLSGYLSEAARFIGSPKSGGGVNTVGDWMALQESKKRETPITENIPTVTSQAEVDALPSGAVFIENGHKYRKPLTENIPTVTSQAKVNALPSGAVFIENGHKYRKPLTENIPTVTSQAEVDALPSGAVFIENGHKYRKP